MDEQKDEIIKKLAEEGKNKADVRRELISQGLGTDGFEIVYEKFAKGPSITKTKQPIKQGQIIGDFASFQINKPPRKSSQTSLGKFVAGCVLILCLIAGYMFFTGKFTVSESGDISTENAAITNDVQNFNVGDKLIQGKVESVGVSAHLFGSRMGSLDGVCNDIIVLDPIVCLPGKESFVVFAPVSNDMYYCVDAKNFRGNLENKPISGDSCQ